MRSHIPTRRRRTRSGSSLCRYRKFLRVAVEPLEDRVMLDGADPVFDAVTDWSQTSNPNGLWSYGYTSALGSPPLILHTNHGGVGELRYRLLEYQSKFECSCHLA